MESRHLILVVSFPIDWELRGDCRIVSLYFAHHPACLHYVSLPQFCLRERVFEPLSLLEVAHVLPPLLSGMLHVRLRVLRALPLSVFALVLVPLHARLSDAAALLLLRAWPLHAGTDFVNVLPREREFPLAAWNPALVASCAFLLSPVAGAPWHGRHAALAVHVAGVLVPVCAVFWKVQHLFAYGVFPEPAASRVSRALFRVAS